MKSDVSSSDIGNELSRGNYIYPYTGPLLFFQPDLAVSVEGKIVEFRMYGSNVYNSETGRVVKPIHFVVFRPLNETRTEFEIVGRKSVPDLTPGYLSVSYLV